MSEEHHTSKDELEPKPELAIYSKRAIWGFSALCSPIFAVFLLRQNLIEYGKKAEANKALAVATAFTLVNFIVANLSATINSSIVLLLNICWGGILVERFFKRHFPEEKYPYKPIWKPVLIALAVSIPLLIAGYEATGK